jgi:DNA-binding beta-propeller fold protein YncE
MRLGRTGARRLSLGALSVLAALAGILVFAALPASAAVAHGFTGSFGAEGSGAGEMLAPGGVAVNQTSHDVYVVDEGNSRVDEFEADGAFVRAWGWGVADGLPMLETCSLSCQVGLAGSGEGQLDSPEAIAVDDSGKTVAEDPSVGAVYVTNAADTVIQKFSAAGKYEGELTGTCETPGEPVPSCPGSKFVAFAALEGVAVDPEGQVWIYQQSGEIDDYSDAAANVFLARRRSQAGGRVERGLAVDSVDDLYVGHRPSELLAKLNSSGAVLDEELGGEGPKTAVAVDPSDDDAYVNAGSGVEVFSPSMVLLETFASKHSVSGSGIAVSAATGTAYVADSAGDDVAVFSLGETPVPPETLSATDETPTSVVLHGALKPPAAKLGYYFEYNAGASCAGGIKTPPKEGESEVSEEVIGLEPSKKYTFCLVAEHSEHTAAGNEVPFTTEGVPPTIVSETVAVPVKAHEASLSGTVVANDQSTECHFQYGQASVTEHEIGCEPESFEGLNEQPVTALVHGLSAGTTYKYRIAAKNSTGARDDAEATFTTAIPPETPAAAEPGDVTSSSATLNGVLNPHAVGEPGSYQFVYRQNATECQGEGEQASPVEPSTAASPQPVSASVTGLSAGGPYTFCLRAENTAGESVVGPPQTFMLAPAVEGASSSDETKESAELEAQINPDGAATTCVFEYGTSTGYGASVPCEPASLGSGTVRVSVSGQLAELKANKEYHWRVTASSAAGTTVSSDHTFVYDTLGVGSPAGSCPDEQARAERSSTRLPDCRAYELVTPPDKNGAVIGNPAFGTGYPQIAEDGDRVIAKSIQCFHEALSCVADRHEEGTPFEFERSGSGWVTHPLAPPASEFETYTSWSYNADTGMVLFSAPSATPTVPPTGPHGYQELFYAREPDGEFVEIGPLEEAGDPSQPLGYIGLAPDAQVFATADLSHVLYVATHPYWNYGPETGRLYEYVGTDKSHPLLVGVRGGYESHDPVSGCGSQLGGFDAGETLAAPLSESGRTVYFTVEGHDSGSSCPGSVTAPAASQLWARVDGEVAARGSESAHSVLISGPASSGCSSECVANATSDKDSKEGGAARDANFEGISDDGSTAVFASEQQFTDNASQGEGDNLYESVCSEPCGSPEEEPGATERRLLDVTDPEGGVKVAGGPRELGVEAISADGSHVYFVAEGVLTGAQENQNHEEAENGADNLYAFERDEADPNGHLVFIATLASSDGTLNWATGQVRVANVTPDGQFLVFMSHKALTADDTRAEGPDQVYEYDAPTGVLTRISVGEDGYNDNGNGGSGGASIVGPYQSAYSKSVPVRLDPTMSNDGAFVFFRSPVALTPGALNDVPVENGEAQNFYEYHEGQVYLISDGRDTAGDGDVAESGHVGAESTSNLLGTDASGSNVFFSTFDQLVPEDVDTELDYYDARICSEGDPCEAPVLEPTLCGEGSCQGAAGTAPGMATPASATFSGAGNLSVPSVEKKEPKVSSRAQKLEKALKACRAKRNKHKRLACEKQAKKRYSSKSSKGRR